MRAVRAARIDPGSARSEPLERVLAQWSQLTIYSPKSKAPGSSWVHGRVEGPVDVVRETI